MNKYYVSVLVPLMVLLAFCNVCQGYDLMNPGDFSHKVRKQSTHKDLYPNLRVKLSIARVHDNQPVNTAFGNKIGGQEAAVTTTDGSAVVTFKNEVRYDTTKDKAGYGKRIREMMRYNLSSIKSIELVEREDINAIIRELDFSETDYVKTKGVSEVEMPRYIAKGFITANDGSCLNEKTSGWNPQPKEKDNNPLIFFIRIYDTRTSLVKYIACGTGQNQAQAIKNAVDNLKAHMDLFYPDVAVSKVVGQKLSLDGGRNQGLVPGARFYIVRSKEGMKATIDYGHLEYVALCKVIVVQSKSATAVIEKKFEDAPPKMGDWVFYHRVRPTW